VTTWTFIWLMFILKVPIVALFLIVRWAVRDPPQPALDEDGGIGPHPRPGHPRHPRSTLPRRPRRGPHLGPAPGSPARVRVASSRLRPAPHR